MAPIKTRLATECPPDSGQNSLEYWDYSIELEMLQGPQDLQLAAELGKTLLERNRELESSLRQQQHVIDDQNHEIEYLTKQTAALREVNDSRLRIYEQLEISIADLEKTNQRLTNENNADKKRIRSLCDTIDNLEVRCEDVGRMLEEAQAQERARLRQQHRRSSSHDRRPSHTLRRVLSVEGGLQEMEGEYLQELLELREEMTSLRAQRSEETRRVRDLQTEMSCLIQENELLQEQVIHLRRREDQMHSWQQEVQTLQFVDRALCRRCSDDGAGESPADPLTGPPSLQNSQGPLPTLLLTEEEEDDILPPQQSCALIRLHNGGYAWGSQESLASIGQVVEPKKEEISEEEDKELGSLSSKWEGDGQRDSLLSELDTQYRVLIQKYEALLEAQQAVQERSSRKSPIPLTDVASSPQRSPHEDLSDSGSSGFLDEPQHHSREVQTEITLSLTEECTPTILKAKEDPTEGHFNHVPEYKQLFQEIFSVLKRKVDYDDAPVSLTPEKKTDHLQISPCQDSVSDSEELEVKGGSSISLTSEDCRAHTQPLFRSSSLEFRFEKPPPVPPRLRQKYSCDSAPPSPALRRRTKRKRSQAVLSPPPSPQPYEYSRVASPLAETIQPYEYSRVISPLAETTQPYEYSRVISPLAETTQPYEYSRVTSPLAEIAKLKKLEKTYAEALASGLKATKQKLRQRFK